MANRSSKPNQPPDPYSGESIDAPSAPHGVYDYDTYPNTSDQGPPIRRVRVAIWDVICTVAIWAALFIVATTTSWPARLFGFVADVCPAGSCPPVPFGIDLWIYPVVWGGIGTAVAAAVIGPCVSLVKGWHMFFWPILAAAMLVLSAVAGSTLTAFSAHYWHYRPSNAQIAQKPQGNNNCPLNIDRRTASGHRSVTVQQIILRGPPLIWPPQPFVAKVSLVTVVNSTGSPDRSAPYWVAT